MASERTLSRREVMVLLGGAVVTITACGSDSSPSGPSGNSGDKTGAVSANHGHVATITSGQLQAGGAIDLNIQGSAGHPHTVNLGASEVVQIRNGDRVSKTSSNNDQHTHTVSFN